jgi:bifunctional UDP-N-acetylglucosamine pyrophosphorylase/glucosamine-1-phosphate N-acetyltransferase
MSGTTQLAVVILAAGEGKRMRSSLPKVLHPVGGRPMLEWSLALGAEMGATRRIVVVSPNAKTIADCVHAHGAETCIQAQPLGTGDAVSAARGALSGFEGDVLGLFADTPLIRRETIEAVLAARAEGAGLVALGFEAADPGRYGRMVTTQDGALARIVEANDASEAELAITLCNSGVMLGDADHMLGWLERLQPSKASGEYYLTDCVALAHEDGVRVSVVRGEESEFGGANNRAQLAAVEATFQQRARAQAMELGVTLVAPETVFFSHDTELERDVRVEPHVVFGPGVRVGEGVVIKSFTHLEGAVVEADAQLGPYARLRPGSDIGKGAKIGNFVEIKKSRLDAGAKVGHLTYLGDAHIGAGANIGAGTITCNYDGVNKHRTEIGAGAFIGSDTALVAPVRVGANAYTGSGSVITRDVPDNALAVARGRQRNIEGWTARNTKS